MAKGKLDPASRGFATIYLIYAAALADQHRDREALPYAEMADKAMAPTFTNETYQDKMRRAQARQLVVSLQSRLGAEGPQNAQSPATKKTTPQAVPRNGPALNQK